MVLNSMLLLLSRSFSAALLMLVDKKYYILYFTSDMGLYLLQKFARGDFHYWMPLEGGLGICISALMRVIVKVVADHTGLVQFRGAAEMGGIYFFGKSIHGDRHAVCGYHDLLRQQ
jgi:hypothetical protein